MSQRRSARFFVIFTFVSLLALPAMAATSDFRVLFDVDNNASTGCTVDGMTGVDQVLVTRVETSDSTGQVTQTYRQVCSGTSLGAPTGHTGGWDVDFKGESGNMTVETRIAYSSLFSSGLPLMRVGFSGQAGTFVQTLGPVMFPEATHGRRRSAQPGDDRIITLDGKTQDWGGITPLAQGSAAGGQKFHVARVYGYGDGADFSFRFDASTLKRAIPTAVNDNYDVRSGQVLVIAAPGVLANDSDPEGGTLSASIVTKPTRGTLTLLATGGFTYSHDGTGSSDFFEYRAIAGGAESNIAKVTISILPNGIPQAFADGYNVAHRGTITVAAPGVLANDNDPDGDPISALRISNPVNGTLVLQSSGALTYTHNGTNTLTDSFTYAAQDGIGQSAPTTVTITIAPDVPPTAVNDAYDVAEGGTRNEAAPGLFANDTDPDTPQSLWSITVVTPPANGTLTMGANGAFTYVHNGGETTSDSFVYRVNDGIASSANATVTITVSPVNDAPVAANDAYTTSEDVPLNVPAPGVLTNDTDAEGTALVMSVVTNPANGTLTPTANGGFLYTPNANFNGTDSFTYTAGDGGLQSNAATVTITVTAVNDEPSFTAGGTVVVLEDSAPYSNAWATTLTRGGGADEAGQTLTFALTGLTNGGLFSTPPSIAGDGTLTFTPAANANGSSTVNVTLTDNGGTANGGDDTSATVVLTINLTAVNDAPSFLKGVDQSVNEDAGAQTVNGWATALSAGPGDESAQTLGFVLSNDNNTLFAVQPAVSSTGVLTYTPAANRSGTAVVNVVIADNGGTANGGVDTSAVQQFNITVNAVNDGPQNSVPGAQNTNEDVPRVFSTANGNAITVADVDAGTNPVRVTVAVTNGTATAAAGSGATLTGNGTNNVVIDGTLTQVNAALNGLTFTPTLNSVAAGTVTITTDDLGNTGSGVPMTDSDPITITINPVNDAPSFTKGTDVTVNEDSGAFTQPGWATGTSAGPTDESAQTLTYNVTNDNNSLFTVQPAIDPATGTLTFTLAANVFGTANVSVTLSDNGGTANSGADTSAPQTFVINVTGVNDEPSFTGNGNVAVNEDSGAYSQNGWVTAGNAGPNEGAQSLSYVVTNDNNSLFDMQPAVDATGKLTFTPAANAFGTANVSITVKDNGGTANGGDDTGNTVNITVTVNAVNDVPSFTKGADVTVNEDSGAFTQAGWIAASSAGPANESGQTLSYTLTNDNNALFSTQPAVDAAGQLTFTPAANAFGTATVTISVSDTGGTANGGIDTSGTQTFTITLTGVNDEPSFTGNGNVTVNEDSGPYSQNGWVTAGNAGPNEGAQSLSYVVTNDNNSLFDTQPAVDATGKLTFTPAANAFGTANVSITVKDNGGTANGGDDTGNTVNITVTVNSVNDVPSFTKGADVTVNEDSGAFTQAGWIAASSAGPANESGQTLSYTLTNDNNALFSTQPAVDAAGQLTFTPAANATGTATVTISVSDTGGTANGGVDTSGPQTFTITLTGVNDEPSFTGNGNVTVNEDSGAYSQNGWVTAGNAGPNEGAQSLSYVVTNDNNALFSTQPAVDATGKLTFTPALNANGSANVSITVKDNGGTANGGDDTGNTVNITVAVTAVNDAPSFTKGVDVTANEDSGAFTQANWIVASSAGPTDESGQTLTYTVTNDNNALFSVQPAVDAAGQLTFTPAANAFGTATVTISASDSGGTANGGANTSGPQTFTITLTGINDEPSFTGNGNVTVNEDSGPYSQNGWVTSSSAGPNEGTQTLSYAVTNDNNSLFTTQPAVDATGKLTFTPALNASGSANVSVTVSDNGGTAGGGDNTGNTVNFTVTLTAVNDAPSFTKGGDVTASEDSGAFTQASWIVASSPGPADESGQTLSYTLTNDNNALFSTQPAVDAAGQLTFTPAANAFGTTTVTISVSDSGGTANGGVNTSGTQTFTITLTGINDEPSFTGNGNVTVNEDSGAQTQNGWVTASSAGPGESSQTLSYTVSNDNNSLFDVQPAVAANGTLTFTPAANAFGTANVSVTVSDDGGTANGGDNTGNTVNFVLTVNPVNDAPVLGLGGDLTVLDTAGAVTTPNYANPRSAGPANESAQTLTFTVTNNNNALFTAQPAVDPATGNLTFTTTAGVNGVATVSVKLADNGGTANGGVDQTTLTFVLTVNQVPAFTSANSTTMTVGQASSFDITVNGRPNAAFSLFSGTLPANLSLTDDGDNTARIHGTPATLTQGVHNLVIRATNSAGTTDQSFTLTIVCPVATFSPAAGALPAGTYNSAYSQALNVGQPGYTYAVTSGALPTGINLDTNNGGLTGTPTVTGNFSFTITATETASGCTTPAAYTLAINPAAVNDSYGVTAGTEAVGNTQVVVANHSSPTTPFVAYSGSVLANDIAPAGATVTVVPITTTGGGSVTIAADGSFTYSPAANFTGDDTFTYTLNSNGATATGTVTIRVQQKVWYVRNNHGGTESGRSHEPFNTLAEAIAASSTNDLIFIYRGDGSSTGYSGNFVMKSGQIWHGESVALTMNGHALVPAATAPQIHNAAGVTIDIAQNATLRGLNVSTGGSTVALQATGIHGIAIDRVTVTGTGGLGISNGTGPINLVNSVINTAGSGSGVSINNGTPAVTFTSTPITHAGGTPIAISSTTGGSTTFHSAVTVTAGNLARAININNVGTHAVTFNAAVSATGNSAAGSTGAIHIGNNAAATTVTFANTVVANASGALGIHLASNSAGTYNFTGASKDVNGDTNTGVLIDGNTGATINITNGGLTVDTTTGTGLFVQGGGAITIDGAGNTVNATAGTAVDVRNSSAVITLATTSSGGGTQNVNFLNPAGAINLGGGALSGATTDSFKVSGGNTTITYSGSISAAASARPVNIQNRAGGTITLSGNVSSTGSGILLQSNASGTVTFQTGTVNMNTGLNTGVSLALNSGSTINFNNGLTATTSSGTAFSATGGGTLSVAAGAGTNDLTTTSGVALNVNGMTIAGGGVNFRNVSANAAAAAAASGIVLSANSGGTVTISGTTQVTNRSVSSIDIDGSGSYTFGATTITGRTAPGIDIDGSTGTISFGTTTVNSGGLTQNAVDINGSTAGSISFSTLNIPASSGAGLSLTNVNAPVTVSAGAFSDATDQDVVVSGGSGSLTFAATITDDLGQLIKISTHSGTRTFTGAITDNNDGDGGSGTVEGSIHLSNNTGSTTFQGGLLLSTGANHAFRADSGAGSVTVCALTACTSGTPVVNTITTTTGGALFVANHNIGANGLTFRSINSTGTGTFNGITLDTTGTAGGLTVTGNGGTCSTALNCTGGAITNKTGTDGSTTAGTGIYLKNTAKVALTRMFLSDFENFGIRGQDVTDFSFIDSVITATGTARNGNSGGENEGSMFFGVPASTTINGILGTATLTNVTIEKGFEDNIAVFNNSGTLNMTIANSIVRDNGVASGNDGVLIEAQSSATMNVTVTGSTFSGNRSNNLQVNTSGTSNATVRVGTSGVAGSGGTWSNSNTSVNLAHGSTGTFTFHILNGTYSNTGAQAAPININLLTGAASCCSSSSALFRGNLIGNTITNNGSATGPALRIVGNSWIGGTLTVNVEGNTINNNAQNIGFNLLARDGNSIVNATIRGNTVTNTLATASHAIQVNSGASAGDTVVVNLDLDNNTTTAPGAGNFGIRLSKISGTTSTIEGYAGNPTDAAAIQTYVSGKNNGATVGASTTGSGWANHAGVPMPPAP